jgi:type I restriction enzyme S subunit
MNLPTIKLHPLTNNPIPEEWGLKRATDICSVITKGTTPRMGFSDYSKDSVPFLRVHNLTFEGKLLTAELKYVTRMIAVTELSRSIIYPGDVLINIVGPPLGKVSFVTKEFSEWNINQAIAVFRTKSQTTGDYLTRYLQLPQATRWLESHSKKTSGQQNLTLELCRLLPLALPPTKEMASIVKILATWDEALTQLDALIEAQERRKKALMQQLLTGRSRLNGFTEAWPRYRFSELLEPQDRYVEFDDEHTYSLVSIRRRSGGVFFREALQGGDIKTKVMKRVHTGDFLISRMQVVHGGLGMVRPECDGMFASDSYDVLIAKDPNLLHMPFLDWMSRQHSFWHLAYISSHGVHIEKMTFKLSDFMHEKITIPGDLNEQRQIAAILDTAQSELTLLRTQRTALDQQKRGLMQRLLTGKLRVKI